MAVSEKMQNVNEHIKRSPLKKYYGAAAFFLLGFLFSIGSALSNLHPFGISVVAVSGKKRAVLCAFGAVLGTLLSGFNAESVRYISAIMLAALGVFVVSAFGAELSAVHSAAIAFITSAVTGFVLDMSLESNLPEYALTLAEAVLSAGGAYFLFRALGADYRRLRFRALPLSEISCIIISVSLLLLNLAPLKIGEVAPAGAVAVLLILLSQRFLGDRYALVCALSFGFVFSLEGEGELYKVGALAFSAMVCSLFAARSDFAVSLSFLCSVGFFCIASSAVGALGFFIEAAVGALSFVLIPSGVYRKMEALSDMPGDTAGESVLRQSLVLRLKFAGAAMSAISESVSQVREKISEISRRENEKHRASMTDEEYASRELILEETNQIRTVASDQLFTVSDMLVQLAGEFDSAELFNSAASSKIRRLLGEYGVYPQSISVVEDKEGRMRVEILYRGESSKLKIPDLSREIGKICSRYFSKGRITGFKEEKMLSFYEKPNYTLDVGSAQHSASGDICGDTVKIMNDGRGHSLLIISDGMGTGARAALDGAMGAGLLSKLINAGFGFDSSLKIINSALLVKSNDESLATLDIANIDLFTGKCELLKAGAPASYIIKDGVLNKCELSSMPAGILRGIEFAKRTAVLSPGDRAVLLSDGITDLGEAFLKDVLSSLGDRASQECADLIVKKALELSDERRIDDMSVIVAQLK